jgi:elongator complex protein 1
VTSLILPGTLEARSSIEDEIEEIRDLLEKQVGRLDELAAKKLSEPGKSVSTLTKPLYGPTHSAETFYGLEEGNLANIDVMTDVSNPGTMFTRYTVAPTSSDRSR